ncbi:MAG: ribonuclease III [Verrucomicrobia bacterium]|nr:ribonuclease III [Verrucomicrobiota bacterium]
MDSIEIRLGYKFRNPLLLAEALTHPSLAYESQKAHFDNQRLEFLGDAVLQLALTEHLFRSFPDVTEGRMTKLRAQLVSRNALAQFAVSLRLGNYILLGKGEEASGGRKRASTLADAFEALLGAIYLDSGYSSARDLVVGLFEQEIGAISMSSEEGNPKGTLQEILQAIGSEAPSYRIVGESGPDHRKVFHAQVFWNGLLLAQGRGKSKKEAEVRAATEALRKKIWLNAEVS